jgi:hypothetical protein
VGGGARFGFIAEPVVAAYRQPRFGRGFVLVGWGAMPVVATIGLLVWSLAFEQSVRAFLFSLVPIVMLLGRGYHEVFRVALGLTLTPSALRWEGAVRSGEMPLPTIISVVSGNGGVKIRHSEGRPIFVVPNEELLWFMDTLAQLRPDLVLNRARIRGRVVRR